MRFPCFNAIWRASVLGVLLCTLATTGCGSPPESDAVSDPDSLGESQDHFFISADYHKVVQQLYVGYFGRPADTIGWVNVSDSLLNANAPDTAPGLDAAYSSNATVRALVDSFGTSAESNALYTGDTSSFVTAIYWNLLNRAPGQEGLTFWTNAINNGGLSRSKAALSILAGALTNTTPQGLIDRNTVEAKTAIATNFTWEIDTAAELTAYQGNIAAAQARNMLALVTDKTIAADFQWTVVATLNFIVDDYELRLSNTFQAQGPDD
jgi:serralysin